jgi:hypothetical protein
MTERVNSDEVLSGFKNNYYERLARADDWDLATRALILAGVALSIAEIGIAAFGKSKKQRVAGALAPVLALGLSTEADRRFLAAQGSAVQSASDALEMIAANSLETPPWVESATALFPHIRNAQT